MSHRPANERRKHVRYRLAVMYTEVEAKPNATAAPAAQGPMRGHVYDISEGGVRIELDEPLDVGRTFELELKLPGVEGSICAAGDVIWVTSPEDDPGPRRMALQFKQYQTVEDRQRLCEYLAAQQIRAVA